MTTREEIEAAASEYRYCYANPTSCDLQEFDRCAHTLATSHVTYLAERQRKIEAAVHRIGVRFMTKESEDAEIREIITRCLDGETT